MTAAPALLDARSRQRLGRAVHAIELRRGAVHVQLENIRPVVVAGEVVPQLHLDAELQVAVGIEDRLLGTKRTGDDAAQWIDDQAAAAAVRIAQEFLALRPGRQHPDHLLVHGPAG